MKTQAINKLVQDLLSSGKIFSVSFVKVSDFTLSKMTVRGGVTKGTKGEDRKKKEGLITVYVMKRGQRGLFRSLYINSITRINNIKLF